MKFSARTLAVALACSALLSGCFNKSEKHEWQVEPEGATSNFPVPQKVQQKVEAENLSAQVQVDNNGWQPLLITGDTASGNVPGIIEGNHKISVRFVYTTPLYDELVLAQAEKNVQVIAGTSTRLEILESDYDLDLFDDDRDGINNADEIAEGTNPLDPTDPTPVTSSAPSSTDEVSSSSVSSVATSSSEPGPGSTPSSVAISSSLSSASSSETIVEPQNNAVADAGPNITDVEEGSLVEIKGFAKDPTAAVTYSWRYIGTDTVELSGASTDTLSFQTGEYLAPQIFAFELVVTVGDTVSAPDTMVVSVNANNDAPVVSFIPVERIVAPNTLVELTPFEHKDPEAQPLTYSWAQLATDAVQVDDFSFTNETASFTSPYLPNVNEPLELNFELTLDDGDKSTTATVKVIVAYESNQAPVAVAGYRLGVGGMTAVIPQANSQINSLGFDLNQSGQVLLDGSASTNAELEETLSYDWAIISGDSTGITLEETDSGLWTLSWDGLDGDRTVEVQLTVNDSAARDPVESSMQASVWLMLNGRGSRVVKFAANAYRATINSAEFTVNLDGATATDSITWSVDGDTLATIAGDPLVAGQATVTPGDTAGTVTLLADIAATAQSQATSATATYTQLAVGSLAFTQTDYTAETGGANLQLALEPFDGGGAVTYTLLDAASAVGVGSVSATGLVMPGATAGDLVAVATVAESATHASRSASTTIAVREVRALAFAQMRYESVVNAGDIVLGVTGVAPGTAVSFAVVDDLGTAVDESTLVSLAEGSDRTQVTVSALANAGEIAIAATTAATAQYAAASTEVVYEAHALPAPQVSAAPVGGYSEGYTLNLSVGPFTGDDSLLDGYDWSSSCGGQLSTDADLTGTRTLQLPEAAEPYACVLTLSYRLGAEVVATATVDLGTVEAVNAPPSTPAITAGTPNAIEREDSLTLTLGAASTDPESQTITYTWQQSLAGASATIVCSDTDTCIFEPSEAGDYEITLVASDGVNEVSSLPIAITVTIPVDPTPSVNVAFEPLSPQEPATPQESVEINLTGTVQFPVPTAVNNAVWEVSCDGGTPILGVEETDGSIASGSLSFTRTFIGFEANANYECEIRWTIVVNGEESMFASPFIVSAESNVPTANIADRNLTITGYDPEGRTDESLDGSASSDPEGDTLYYQWSQDPADAVQVEWAPGAQTSEVAFFFVPQQTVATTLNFSLTVCDAENDPARCDATPATIAITVAATNQAPIAIISVNDVEVAGANDEFGRFTAKETNHPAQREEGEGEVVVTVSAELSSDSAGEQLTFSWVFGGGTAEEKAWAEAELGLTETDWNAESFSFVTPNLAQTDTLLFILTVSDGALSTSKDLVVTIEADNDAPIVSATSDVSNVTSLGQVQLSSTVIDPDIEHRDYPVNITWSALPDVIDFGDNENQPNLTITAPNLPDATTSVELTATAVQPDDIDNLGGSDSVQLTIGQGYFPPAVNVTYVDTVLEEGAKIQLQAIVTGNTSEIASYTWELADNCSDATFEITALDGNNLAVESGSKFASTAELVLPNRTAIYDCGITVTVNDSEATPGTDTFTLTLEEVTAVDEPPRVTIVSAGLTAAANDTMVGQLEATVIDPEGLVADYSWAQTTALLTPVTWLGGSDTGSAIDAVNGTISAQFEIAVGAEDIDLAFTLSANDDTTTSQATTQTLTIVTNNQAPSAGTNSTQAVNESEYDETGVFQPVVVNIEPVDPNSALALDDFTANAQLEFAWTLSDAAKAVLDVGSLDLSNPNLSFTVPNIIGRNGSGPDIIPLSFTLRVTDAQRLFSESNHTINVAANDDFPIITNVTTTVTQVAAGDSATLEVVAFDPEGLALTYEWSVVGSSSGTNDNRFSNPNSAVSIFTIPSEQSNDEAINIRVSAWEAPKNGSDRATNSSLVIEALSGYVAPTVDLVVSAGPEEDQSVTVNATVNFRVAPTSPTYTWVGTCDGNAISLTESAVQGPVNGEGLATLSASFTAPAAIAGYSCNVGLTVDDGVGSDAVAASTDDFTLIADNDAPVVTTSTVVIDAIVGMPVNLTATVTDDGPASTTQLQYSWTANNLAAQAELSDSSSVNPTFVPPAYPTDTLVTFTVTVTDGAEASRTDQQNAVSSAQVQVNVAGNNQPPVAVISDETGTALTGEVELLETEAGAAPSTLVLSAANSTDDFNAVEKFEWAIGTADIALADLGLTIADLTAESIEITAPNLLVETSFSVSLVVVDTQGNRSATSPPTNITVKIVADNDVPSAPTIAGIVNNVIEVNQPLLLTGNLVATDPESQPITYRWEQVLDATATVICGNVETCNFIPSQAGEYSIALIASDGVKETSSALVNITAVIPIDPTPIVSLQFTPELPSEGTPVTLTTTATFPEPDAISNAGWDIDCGGVPVFLTDSESTGSTDSGIITLTSTFTGAERLADYDCESIWTVVVNGEPVVLRNPFTVAADNDVPNFVDGIVLPSVDITAAYILDAQTLNGGLPMVADDSPVLTYNWRAEGINIVTDSLTGLGSVDTFPDSFTATNVTFYLDVSDGVNNVSSEGYTVAVPATLSSAPVITVLEARANNVNNGLPEEGVESYQRVSVQFPNPAITVVGTPTWGQHCSMLSIGGTGVTPRDANNIELYSQYFIPNEDITNYDCTGSTVTFNFSDGSQQVVTTDAFTVSANNDLPAKPVIGDFDAENLAVGRAVVFNLQSGPLTDLEGQSITYSWLQSLDGATFTEIPECVNSIVQCIFRPSVAGDYSIKVVVSDGIGDVESDIQNVSVFSRLNFLDTNGDVLPELEIKILPGGIKSVDVQLDVGENDPWEDSDSSIASTMLRVDGTLDWRVTTTGIAGTETHVLEFYENGLVNPPSLAFLTVTVLVVDEGSIAIPKPEIAPVGGDQFTVGDALEFGLLDPELRDTGGILLQRGWVLIDENNDLSVLPKPPEETFNFDGCEATGEMGKSCTVLEPTVAGEYTVAAIVARVNPYTIVAGVDTTSEYELSDPVTVTFAERLRFLDENGNEITELNFEVAPGGRKYDYIYLEGVTPGTLIEDNNTGDGVSGQSRDNGDNEFDRWRISAGGIGTDTIEFTTLKVRTLPGGGIAFDRLAAGSLKVYVTEMDAEDVVTPKPIIQALERSEYTVGESVTFELVEPPLRDSGGRELIWSWVIIEPDGNLVQLSRLTGTQSAGRNCYIGLGLTCTFTPEVAGEYVISAGVSADDLDEIGELLFSEEPVTVTFTPLIIDQDPLNFVDAQGNNIAGDGSYSYETFVGDDPFTFAALGGSGDGAVTYSSSNELVAKVDALTGEVTPGSRAGTAIIEAQKEGGAEFQSAFATYEFTVLSHNSPLSESIPFNAFDSGAEIYLAARQSTLPAGVGTSLNDMLGANGLIYVSSGSGVGVVDLSSASSSMLTSMSASGLAKNSTSLFVQHGSELWRYGLGGASNGVLVTSDLSLTVLSAANDDYYLTTSSFGNNVLQLNTFSSSNVGLGSSVVFDGKQFVTGGIPGTDIWDSDALLNGTPLGSNSALTNNYLYARDGFAYALSDTRDAIDIIDIASSSPSIVKTVEIGLTPDWVEKHVVAIDNRLYVIGYRDFAEVIDISDPTQARHIGRYLLNGPVSDSAAIEKTLVLNGGQTLYTIDTTQSVYIENKQHEVFSGAVVEYSVNWTNGMVEDLECWVSHGDCFITGKNSTSRIAKLTWVMPNAAEGVHMEVVVAAGGKSFQVVDHDRVKVKVETRSRQNDLEILGVAANPTSGDSFTLSASGGSGSGEFIYLSSDPSIARVDSITGDVNLVGVGDVTLTVVRAGDDQFASNRQVMSINVVANEPLVFVGSDGSEMTQINAFVGDQLTVTVSGFNTEAPTISTIGCGGSATFTPISQGTGAVTVSGASETCFLEAISSAEDASIRVPINIADYSGARAVVPTDWFAGGDEDFVSPVGQSLDEVKNIALGNGVIYGFDTFNERVNSYRTPVENGLVQFGSLIPSTENAYSLSMFGDELAIFSLVGDGTATISLFDTGVPVSPELTGEVTGVSSGATSDGTTGYYANEKYVAWIGTPGPPFGERKIEIALKSDPMLRKGFIPLQFNARSIEIVDDMMYVAGLGWRANDERYGAGSTDKASSVWVYDLANLDFAGSNVDFTDSEIARAFKGIALEGTNIVAASNYADIFTVYKGFGIVDLHTPDFGTFQIIDLSDADNIADASMVFESFYGANIGTTRPSLYLYRNEALNEYRLFQWEGNNIFEFDVTNPARAYVSSRYVVERDGGRAADCPPVNHCLVANESYLYLGLGELQSFNIKGSLTATSSTYQSELEDEVEITFTWGSTNSDLIEEFKCESSAGAGTCSVDPGEIDFSRRTGKARVTLPFVNDDDNPEGHYEVIIGGGSKSFFVADQILIKASPPL